MKELFDNFITSLIATVLLVSLMIVTPVDMYVGTLKHMLQTLGMFYAVLTVWYGLRTLFTRKEWDNK